MCITQSLVFFPVPHRIGKGVVTKTQFLWKTTVCNRRRGLMGKCAWFKWWWWWWTWWEKGWRGALLGAPVGDGNPCSSGRWLPWTWWKPSGQQSFTCALRCSQEKGADFLEIQDCHQLLRNLPFSVGKFLEVFYHRHFTLAAGGLANTRSTYWRSLTERSNWNWSVSTCWAFFTCPVLKRSWIILTIWNTSVHGATLVPALQQKTKRSLGCRSKMWWHFLTNFVLSRKKEWPHCTIMAFWNIYCKEVKTSMEELDKLTRDIHGRDWKIF